MANTSNVGTSEVSVAREVHTYRTVDGVPLEARVLVPNGDAVPRPAIAYFHPGAWRAGGPGFSPSLQYLASRGMVAASFAYRLLPNRRKSDGAPGVRYGAAASIRDCVADAQAAVRWLRRRPDVDGTRVVAAGYSSGGHLAAATALLPPVEPVKASCRPNSLVMYAGVFELGDAELSPLRYVRPKAPPGLVLYGVRDTLAGQGRRFAEAMSDAGNRCEVAEFSGDHGTFSSRPDNPVWAASLARVDEFLVSLGYLDAVPDVERRIANLGLPASKPKTKRATTNSQAASRKLV